MRRFFWFVATLLLCVTPAAAQAPKPAKPGKIRHVIVISVDGLMPAALHGPDEHGLKIPTLRELARTGALADPVTSVFPTITYPAHTSIATGTRPAAHGIVRNAERDPFDSSQSGWLWYAEDIRTTALWDAARSRGLRTALVYWPVTVGARATFLVPEFWTPATADDQKMARALSTPGLLEGVAARFENFWERFTPPQVEDSALTDVAVHLIETQRPHLLMLHIFEVDHYQHYEGLWSERTRQAIENADAQIARVIAAAKKAGIWQQTALVVVSDHGFAPIAQRLRPGVLLREKGLVTLDGSRVTDWKAMVVTGAAHAYVYVRDPADAVTRQALLDTFLPLAGQAGSGIGRVYRQEEIGALGGDPQALLALEAAEGFTLASGYTGELISPSTQQATHGFHPDRADMQASLLIAGPPIPHGRIRGARLIDVAPTVAEWLGLKLGRVEGRALRWE